MDSDLIKFYNNSNVLVTGGMGFFGKVLLQKLLRECKDITGIYLLVRPKREKDINTRMEEVYKDALFEKLKEQNPDFKKKVHLIEGDCSKLGLGLKEEDRSLLIENINIVFHAAACLNMDGKVKESINTNVRGTREMLSLCHEIKNLKSAVLISTAYSNCHNFTIEERFYEPPVAGETLIKLSDELDDTILENITPGLVDKMPNTYVFTKCVSEDIVKKLAGNLPVALFRPSIVFTSLSDPISGWTDNVYGPAGVCAATGMGLMRTFYCDVTKSADLVPIDYCINGLIASAWDLTTHQKHVGHEIPIYNYSTGLKYSRNWGQLKKGSMKSYKYPFSKAMWVTISIFVNNPYLYWFLDLFLHYIPALVIDTFLLLTAQKTMMLKLCAKVHRFTDVLKFFTTKEFNIINKNVLAVWDRLNKVDQSKFPFDVRTINWDKVYADCNFGIKYYLIKDKPEDLEKDIKRYKRMVLIHNTILCVLGAFAVWSSYKLYSLFI